MTLRLHNEELVLPVLVKTPHENPEHAITVSDAGPLRGALENNDLLFESHVLGNELRLSRSQCHDEIGEMLNVLHLRDARRHGAGLLFRRFVFECAASNARENRTPR